MRYVLFATAAAHALVPSIACAQWSDNFDSYTIGSINGQGGWKGWDNVAAAAGVVSTTQALSAPHSQAIGGAADSVREYTGITSGTWNYSGQVYIPSGITGIQYFILLNIYVDGGGQTVNRWSMQARFNLNTNMVDDDTTSTAGSAGTIPRPIVRDAWVPLSATFDLTANTLSWTYNGQLVWSGTWTRGTAGAVLQLQAVDLYNQNATGSIFWDNLNLAPVTAACYPNCDASTASPILNVADFTCFLTKYAAGDPYANCDASTAAPTLNVADFTCFLTKYAAGCP